MLQADAAAETGAQRLDRGFLGSEASGKEGDRSGRDVCLFVGRQQFSEENIAVFFIHTRNARQFCHIETQADNHE